VIFPSSLFDWVGGPSGGFDAPHIARVSSRPGGSGVGQLAEPPAQQQLSTVSEEEVLAAANCGGAWLSFNIQLCRQTNVVWQARLLDRTLYLSPGESLPEGSKDAFVAFLEYAEETLKCQHIIVCFRKSAVTKALIRTFMFLGFTPLPPQHPKSPSGDHFALLYTVDEEETDPFE